MTKEQAKEALDSLSRLFTDRGILTDSGMRDKLDETTWDALHHLHNVVDTMFLADAEWAIGYWQRNDVRP